MAHGETLPLGCPTPFQGPACGAPAGLHFQCSLLKTLQLENSDLLGDSTHQVLNVITFSFRAFDPCNMREFFPSGGRKGVREKGSPLRTFSLLAGI